MCDCDEQSNEWESVLLAAARLQGLLGEGVLVGGTAAALIARHRFSHDADHVLEDLKGRFDEVLATLEAVAGWETARVQRPIQILGSLDGIETGIRQLIRKTPLETTEATVGEETIRIPTPAEILRIKAILILKRNAARDYLDFAAIAQWLGPEKTIEAMSRFDDLYRQDNGESPLMQLQVQLSNPMPYDLESDDLSEYRHLAEEWRSWRQVADTCKRIAVTLFDQQPGNGEIRHPLP